MSALTLLISILVAVSTTELLGQAQPASSEEKSAADEWNRSIRGFRRDHNFTTSLGRSVNHWSGQISNSDTRFSFRNTTHQVKISYSFHLSLIHGFGYYLGTSSAYLFAESNRRNEAAETSYALPGIEFGFSWNVTERFRLTSGIELGWQRIEKLSLPASLGRSRLSVTGETRVSKTQAEYFYELSWACAIVYEYNELRYVSGSDLSIGKRSKTWSLGFTKHLI